MEAEQDSNKPLYVDKLKLIESHYFSLPSQGNIYTLVPLKYSDGKCKILVSSLQKEIYCIEFENGKYLVHEIPLTGIPNGSDIISLNAIRTTNGKFNVGLTLVLKDGQSEQCFFNVYTDWDIERSACASPDTSGFLSVQLNFIPYILYSASYPTSEGDQTVWLISGSDRRIHLYPSTVVSPVRSREDTTLEDSFPELSQVQGITLLLDILYVQQKKRRVTITSGESGNVHVFNIDVSSPKRPKILSSQKVHFDFPSSAVKLFYPFNRKADVQSDLKAEAPFDSSFLDRESRTEPLALVTTTLESCFVHSAEDFEQTSFYLPESENFDVVTSCLICDIDFDGVNEIVLGTYGQVVLIYKLTDEISNWELVKTIYFPSPVLALAYEDILGDGIKELVVSTMAGLHVYQTDPENAAALIIQRLRKLKMS